MKRKTPNENQDDVDLGMPIFDLPISGANREDQLREVESQPIFPSSITGKVKETFVEILVRRTTSTLLADTYYDNVGGETS